MKKIKGKLNMKPTPEQKLIKYAIDRSTTSADTLPSATRNLWYEVG